MKFITKKSEIAESLQLGAAIAERRQTIPVLANLKIPFFMMHHKICIPEEVEETVQDLVNLSTVAISSSKTRACMETKELSLRMDHDLFGS